MTNPFDDISAPAEESMANPFDAVNPFDVAGMDHNQTAISAPKEEPPSFDRYGLPTSTLVDGYLKSITSNRDRAANIVAMSSMYGMSPSLVNDHYDDLNTMKDQPEAYRFIPQLAIAGGMLAAPILSTIRGVQASVPLWKYLLGFGAFAAEEEANAFVRSKIEKRPMGQVKPYGLSDLGPENSDNWLRTLLGTLDIFAKGAAIHAGYKGLKGLWEPMVRETIYTQGLPKLVYIDPVSVSGIDEFAQPEAAQAFWDFLGVNAEDLALAKKHGMQVEVDASKLITIADKPWWGKVKSLFGITPYEQATVELGKQRGRPLGGLLGEPGKSEATGGSEPPLLPKPGTSPSVQSIASAIKQIESGGNYDAVSRDGGRGAYQFTGTWEPWSMEYNREVNGKDLALPMTPENQDAVAEWKIGKLVAAGYSPDQIASIWNSGSPEWQGKTGVNSSGVAYDVPAYIDKFRSALDGVQANGSVPVRVPRRASMVDVREEVTTESLLDGLARGDLDFSLIGTSEGDIHNIEPDDFKYPDDIVYLHEVVDPSKRDSLVKSMEENGWEGPPILVFDNGNGVFALTGSHRWSAAKKADIDIPVKFLDFDAVEEWAETTERSFDDLLNGRNEDRLEILKQIGDEDAIALMEYEIEKAFPGPSIPPSGGGQSLSLQSGGKSNAYTGNRIGSDSEFSASPEQIRNCEQSLVAGLNEGLRGKVRPAGELGPEHRRAAEVVRQFGLSPVFFQLDDAGYVGMGGFIDRADPGTVYFNASSTANPVYTAFHESIHALSASDPERYNDLLDVLLDAVDPSDFDSYSTWLDGVRDELDLPLLTLSKMQEEFAADISASVLSGDMTKLSESHLDISHMVSNPETVRRTITTALEFNPAMVGAGGGVSLELRGKQPSYEEIMAEASRRVRDVVEERLVKERKKLESKLRKEAEAIVDEDPLQRTIKEIVSMKGFSPDHLKKLGYGKDMISDLKAVHRGLVTKGGRARADEIAMDAGLWDSSDLMIEAIINSAPRKESIDRITDGLMSEHATEREIDAAYAYGEILSEEIRIMNELTAGSTRDWENVPRKGIKKVIDDLVGVKKISEATKITEYDALKAAMKKAQTASRQAWTAGNREGALAAKLKERSIFTEYKASLEAKRKADVLVAKIKSLSHAKVGLTGISPEAADTIYDILKPYARRFGLPDIYSNVSGYDLKRFFDEAQAAGEQTVNDPASIYNLTRKPWGALSLSELEQLYDSIKEVVDISRRAGKTTFLGKKVDFQKLRDDAAQAILDNAGKRKVRPKMTYAEKVEENASKGRGASDPGIYQRYVASRQRIEFMLDAFDGWPEKPLSGTNWNAIFRPIAEAEDAKVKMAQEWYPLFDAAVKDFERAIGSFHVWMNTKVTVDGKIWNNLYRWGVWVNAQNKGNRRALRSYFKDQTIDPKDYAAKEMEEQHADQIIDALNAMATPAEVKFFHSTMDLANHFWPRLSQAFRERTGQRLKKEENYWPLDIDPEMSQRASAIKDSSATKDLFQGQYTYPTMKRGFEHERKGTSLPPNLDALSVLLSSADSVMHRIAYGGAVRDVQKLISDEKWSLSVRRVYGDAAYNELMPWLQYVANPFKDSSVSSIDRIADLLRRNTTLSTLGLSLSASTKHFFEWPATVDELGFENTMHGFYSWVRAMVSGNKKDMLEWVNSLSGQMAESAHNWDRDAPMIYDQLTRANPDWSNWVKQHLMALMAFSDQLVRYPCWLEAYDHAIKGKGAWSKYGMQESATAVAYADKVVRRTKAMGNEKDLASVMRGRGAKRLFTMYMTFFSMVDNRVREANSRLRNDPKYSFLDWLKSYWWLLVMAPMLTEAAVKRRVPDAKEMAEDVALFYVARMPFLRDAVSSAITGFEYFPTPALQGFKEAVQLARSVAEPHKPGDEAVSVSRALDAVGQLNFATKGWYAGLAGFPTRQMVTLVKGSMDLASGKSRTLLSLIDRSAEKHRVEEIKKSAFR